MGSHGRTYHPKSLGILVHQAGVLVVALRQLAQRARWSWTARSVLTVTSHPREGTDRTCRGSPAFVRFSRRRRYHKPRTWRHLLRHPTRRDAPPRSSTSRRGGRRERGPRRRCRGVPSSDRGVGSASPGCWAGSGPRAVAWRRRPRSRRRRPPAPSAGGSAESGFGLVWGVAEAKNSRWDIGRRRLVASTR